MSEPGEHVIAVANEAVSKLVARHCYTKQEAVDALRSALTRKLGYGQVKRQPWKPGEPR